MLLGGAPFEEEIVMWWNFIGRSHDEIVAQREAWNGDGLAFEPERFGGVRDFGGDRLLAPPMPTTRLKPRGRPACGPGGRARRDHCAPPRPGTVDTGVAAVS